MKTLPWMIRPARLLFSVLIPCLILPGLAGKLVDDWAYQHPRPHNGTFWKVEYGNGTYVMTGFGGFITNSEDLAEFDTTFLPGMESIDGLTFANGAFMATSRTGKVLTSADGKDWTIHDSGQLQALNAVTYANGRYVAVGANGTTATSTDGINWTIGDIGDDYWYYGVAYGAGRFVAVSYDWNFGSTSGNIATSTDGQNWEIVTLDNALPEYHELYDITYADGLFVACGYFYNSSPESWGVLLMTSPDGLNWTQITGPSIPTTNQSDSTPTWLNMVRHDGQQFVGVGDRGLMLSSTDGASWTASKVGLISESTDAFAITFNGGTTVVVGARGKVWSSQDRFTWSGNLVGNYTRIDDIAFNGTQYITAGSTLMLSTDGRTWETQISKLDGTLRNIVYGAGRWVVGSDLNGLNNPLSTSLDGITWDYPPTLPSGFEDCRSLTFGNGRFIALPAAGSNSLVTSTDGLTWTGSSHPWFDAALGKAYITYGDGQFLAWRSPDPTVTVAVSTDGISWDIYDTGTTTSILAGSFGGDRWVLVGSNGQVITSTNLSDWSEQVISWGDDDPVILHDVAYGNGHWVIVGRSKSIWSSTDGLTWESAFRTGQTGSTQRFNGVAFDGSTFWTVGSSGDILQSEEVTAPAFLSIHPSGLADQVQLQVIGPLDSTWEILFAPSPAAGSWDVLTTISIDETVEIHEDPVTGNRFYRLREGL